MEKELDYKLVSEFIGTYILSLGANFSTYIDASGQVVSDFKVLLACICTAILVSTNISADFNPGVTYLNYITEKNRRLKREKGRQMISYYCVQVVAYILGCLTSYHLNSGIISKLGPSVPISFGSVFFMEIFCTTVFYFVLLILGDSRNQVTNDKFLLTFATIAGIATGSGMGKNFGGPGMNPAVGFGSGISRFIATGDLNELKLIWVYIIGPFIAAHLSNSFYEFVNTERTRAEKSQ